MADTCRLFLALWPDGPVRERVTATLQQTSVLSHPGRPVAPENLHITLRYIGAVDNLQLACIRHAVAAVALTPFTLQLDHQGCWDRPQVAWLGMQQIPDVLQQLARDIDEALQGCGIEPLPGPFVPHMTFMRKIRHLPATTVPPISWRVDSFVLVLSESSPQGVRYTVLNRWS